jgi:exoribonuclease R
MFKMSGAYLTNIQNNKVAWVHADQDQESRHIYVDTRKNKTSQQWDIIYAEHWKRDPKKGELNRRFGLYVERDFYIISRLRSGRYLDALNRNFVIKTRNGRPSQKWWFHQQSLTIKSRQYNQSWNILGNGGQQNINVSGTNSNWW